MRNKKYRVVIAVSAKRDVAEKKNYILEHFQYRQYAEDFSQKMKTAISQLDTFPTGYAVTVLRILQNRMNWRYIIWDWINKDK